MAMVIAAISISAIAETTVSEKEYNLPQCFKPNVWRSFDSLLHSGQVKWNIFFYISGFRFDWDGVHAD